MWRINYVGWVSPGGSPGSAGPDWGAVMGHWWPLRSSFPSFRVCWYSDEAVLKSAQSLGVLMMNNNNNKTNQKEKAWVKKCPGVCVTQQRSHFQYQSHKRDTQSKKNSNIGETSVEVHRFKRSSWRRETAGEETRWCLCRTSTVAGVGRKIINRKRIRLTNEIVVYCVLY